MATPAPEYAGTFGCLCVICEKRFPAGRLDQLTCGEDACRKAFSRNGRRIPGDDKPAPYRPESPALALKALNWGIPFDQLVLSREERDLFLVACHKHFAWKKREVAAGHLRDGRFHRIGKIRQAGLPSVQLKPVDVMVAVAGVWRPTNEIGTRRNGKRLSGPPPTIDHFYVPAEYPFALLLRDFLPRALERRAESERQQAWAFAEPRSHGQLVWIEESNLSPYSAREAERDVVGYTLPSRQHVIEERPAFRELHFDEQHEGPLDPMTMKKEYWKARRKDRDELRRLERRRRPPERWGRTSSPPDPDKLAAAAKCMPECDSPDWQPERRPKVSTTALERIEAKVDVLLEKMDRVEAAQSGQLQEQLASEAAEYLEEVDD